MSYKSYLDLVTDMIRETGLNGGVPPASISQASGDQAKVTYWIQVADMQIQRERIDWDFLWGQYDDAPLSPGSNVVPLPTEEGGEVITLNTVPEKRLAVIDANGQPHFPCFMDWNEFSVLFNFETQDESDYPAYWTLRRDRTIRFSEPIASSGLICKYEYYRKPKRLLQDDDVSLIPYDFDRIIVLLAKILYAEHEDAPEVEQGSTAQYNHMLDQMRTIHIPGAEYERSDDHELMVVETG